MRILLSGASSFTGYWFAKAMAEKGHDVCALFQGESQSAYSGVRLARVQEVEKLCQAEFGATFGETRFMQLLDDGNWDVYCHHASDVTNYRSPDFDPVAATLTNTFNLRAIWEALGSKGACAVWTGSVFEGGEGSGSEHLPDITRYGLSKRLSWSVGLYEAQQVGLPIGKFVIPNPFGPVEEPRFTSYLFKSWAAGDVPCVRTPKYVRDNIPVSLLALDYVDFVEETAATRGVTRRNPSGYVSSMGDFAQLVAKQAAKRLGRDCPLELFPQTEFEEPLVRINTEPSSQRCEAWSEAEAWDEYIEFYSDIVARA